jgi:rare lipoprotein A
MSSGDLRLAGRIGIAAACVAIALAGCKSKQPAQPVANTQTGVASWYGKSFDGRQTASGEIFDMTKLTAAHLTLPLGSIVHVENLSNHQSVNVKINDRGPFVADRIIDLSYAAAQTISMPGVATVILTVISTPPTRAAPIYAVQVGDFTDRAKVSGYRDQLVARYGTARIVFRDRDQSWRVLVGIFATQEAANVVANQLNQHEGPAFVVMVDDEN